MPKDYVVERYKKSASKDQRIADLEAAVLAAKHLIEGGDVDAAAALLEETYFAK